MRRIALTTTTIALGLGALAMTAQAQTKAPPAKLSMTQARAIALKAAPGKVVEADYEKEDGGWRYSFDVRENGKIHEIGVDANSGKIVENSWEGAEDSD